VHDLAEDLARARLGWVSPRLREWYDDARLQRQLATGLADEAERFEAADFGAGFRDQVANGASDDPLDWANRLVVLRDGGWVVTGIRFRALDVKRPFVDVVATTEPPTPDGLATVAAAVVPAYAPFGPLCLRFDVPDPAGLVERLGSDDRFGGTCSVDQYVVAGQVAALRARQRAESYGDISLRAGAADELAERAAAIYDELGRRNPELGMWASPEDAESLAACAEEGLLFDVLRSGEPVGVVAAIREDAHGMSGFCVQELCLAAGSQGRGLAAGVLQRLADELPAGDGDVLWGTIHPDNTPSLRNSLSVGREVVGGLAWVTPAGLPGMPAAADAAP
jgi:hypothetical protein